MEVEEMHIYVVRDLIMVSVTVIFAITLHISLFIVIYLALFLLAVCHKSLLTASKIKDPKYVKAFPDNIFNNTFLV